MDDADRVSDMDARQLSGALAHHARRPRAAGRATCANLDCAAPIASLRQQIGAQLCIDCANEEEARARHMRGGSR